VADKWDENFMQKRVNLVWRAERMVSAIGITLSPTSVLDVGCSVGEFVQEFRDRNIPAWGIDISHWATKYCTMATRPYIHIIDFLKMNPRRLPGPARFNLVMAIEFFSIIDPADHDKAVENMLYIGSKHFLVCCGEDKRFGLKEKFLDRGLIYNAEAVDEIRFILSPFREKLAFKAFYNGLMIFRKETT